MESQVYDTTQHELTNKKKQTVIKFALNLEELNHNQPL